MTSQYATITPSGTRSRAPLQYRNGDGTMVLRLYGDVEAGGTRTEWRVNTEIDRGHDGQCVEMAFKMLAWWWHEDTDGLSSPRRKTEHPAYRYIIDELGEAAIPFILKDLRDRGGSWFHALRSLTAGPEIPPEDHGNVRAIKAAWLSWGRECNLID